MFWNVFSLSILLGLSNVYAETSDVSTIEQVQYTVPNSGFSGYTGVSSTEITQKGDDNYANVTNLGANKVDITQYGSQQDSTAFVIGDGNLVGITQTGFNNDSVTRVDGESNNVAVSQFGNGDKSNITIEGNNNVISVSQIGDNLNYALSFKGSNAGLTIIQH